MLRLYLRFYLALVASLFLFLLATAVLWHFTSGSAEQAGITLGGNRPTDLVVHDERTYPRVFAHGSLGLGEAYMEGWWDVGLQGKAR